MVRETKLHEQILCGLTVDTGFRMMAECLSESGIDPGERLYLTMRIAQRHWLFDHCGRRPGLDYRAAPLLPDQTVPAEFDSVADAPLVGASRARAIGRPVALECAGARPADWPGWPGG